MTASISARSRRAACRSVRRVTAARLSGRSRTSATRPHCSTASAFVHIADIAAASSIRWRRAARSNSAASARCCVVPLRKDDALLGHDHRLPPRGAAVHRQADRAAAEFRGAGGDRDGERAAHHRDARGVGAADRDRRGAAGHQFLARRPRAGVRRDARKGDAPVRAPRSAALQTYDGERFAAVAMHGVPEPLSRDLLREPFAPRPGYRLGALLRGERVVHIADVAAEGLPIGRSGCARRSSISAAPARCSPCRCARTMPCSA